jgi:hypothetical protein
MAKEKTEFKKKEELKKVKLGEIFECEGHLYAIQIPKTASTEPNLNYGRSIYEFITIDGI